MASDPAERGENTRAVHLPAPPPPAQQPLAGPAYRSAAFGSSAEYAALLPGSSAQALDALSGIRKERE